MLGNFKLSKESIFLDASTLLELYLRRPKSLQIQTILAKFDKLYITPITIGILFYYTEKEKLDLQIAEFLVDNCHVLAISDSTYKIA